MSFSRTTPKQTAHEWTEGVSHDWIDLSHSGRVIWVRRDQVAGFWVDASWLHVTLCGASEPVLMLPRDQLPKLMAALGLVEGA